MVDKLNFSISGFWSKPNLKPANADETKDISPIKLTNNSEIGRKELDLQSPYASMGVSFTKIKTIEDIGRDIINQEFPKLKPMTPEIARGIANSYTNLALKECPNQYMQELALAYPETALHAEQFMNKFLG